MALTEKLEFLLSADPTQAVSAFQRVGQESAKSLGAVESNIAKVGATMSKIGAAGVGIGGLLTIMGSGDIEAANQLKAAVAGVGQSYEEYAARLESTAQAQAKFGHTDEEANRALATLTTAYGDAGAAIDRMQLVENIAAARHVSLAAAADMVAKIHGGSTKVLKTFGIQVQDNANGSKDLEGALDQLSQRLNGQAAGSVDSFTGRLKVLAAEGENFVSGIGQKFGPAILGLSAILTTVGTGTAAVSGALASRAEASALAAAAAEADAVALAEVVAAEQEVTGSTAASVASLYAMTAAEEEAGAASTGLMGVLGPLGIALGIAAVAVSQFGGDSVDAAGDIKRLASAGADKILEQFQHLDRFSQLQVLGKLSEGGPESIGILSQLRDQVKAAGGDWKPYQDLIDKATIAQQNQTAATQAGQAAMGDTSGTDAQSQSLKTLQQSAKDTETAYDKVLAAYMRLLPASLQVQGGPDRIAAANAKIADAQSKLGTGKDTAENEQFQRDYNEAVRDGQSAVNDYAQAQVDLQVAQDAAIGKTDNEADKTYMYRSALGSIADTLNGPVHDAIVAHLADLDAIAAKQQFLAAVAYGQALRAAAAGGDMNAQNILSSDPNATVNDSGQLQHRATGGLVQPGAYLVGERGPELLQLGGYGNVTNAKDTAAFMARAGGSSQPVVINNHVTSPDVAEAASRGTRRGLILSRR